MVAARPAAVRTERIEPLWDRVDRNRIELAAFIVLLLAASAAFAAILLGVVLIAVTLVTEEPGRWAIVFDNIGVTFALWSGTVALGVGVYVAPALWVLETSNVNAFVFAKGQRRPVVGVTRGLAERLTPNEQRAVFANLMARLRAGDTIWATGVTAIMAPLWTIREYGLTAREDPSGEPTRLVRIYTEEGVKEVNPAMDARMLLFVAWLFPVIVFFIVVSEYIAFGHRRSQLRHAEVADAEGMLLLKDPRSMLAALEKCVRFNNYVPTAGPGFTQLFYCWTGAGSTGDEYDPEYRRVTRLREVLGAEGLAEPRIVHNEPVLAPPAAPRLEG